ncbi:MAG: hypothetical protein H7240_10315 [Glaciimonas sp.]|nr:hypothetical protein [Glaciimonas sp.]
MASELAGYYRQMSSSAEEVTSGAVELAVATDQLAVGATMQANFSLLLATSADAILDTVIEALYNQGIARSNQISLQPGADKSPDLMPLATAANVAVGGTATHVFREHNIGDKSTDPTQAIIVRATLPAGLSIVNVAPGAKW